MNNAKNTVWNGLKLLLASAPSFSLLLASLYYYIFFSHFDGLNLNILSLGDYINKSVEFIPIVSMIIIFFLVNTFLRPPQLKDEADENYYQRIGGSKKVWETLDRFTFVSIILGTILLVLSGAMVFTPVIFLINFGFLTLFIFTGPILLAIAKHTPESFSKKFMTGPYLYLFIMIIFLIVFVVKASFNDADKIMRKPAFTESKLVDVFEVGYLKHDGMVLVLEDKKGAILTKVEVPIYDNRNVACRIGVKSRCPKNN